MTRPSDGPELAALRAYLDAEQDPPPQVLARVRTHTMGGLADVDAATDRARSSSRAAPRRHGRRRQRWLVTTGVTTAAAAVAVAAIAAGAVGPHRQVERGPAGPGSDLAAGSTPPGDSVGTSPVFLQQVASRSVLAAPLRVGDRQVLYTRARSVGVSAVAPRGGNGANEPSSGRATAWVVSETVTETWAVPGGLTPARVRQTINVNARALSPTDEATLGGPASTVLQPRTVEMATPGARTAEPVPKSSDAGLFSPTPAYLASLPTEPDRLLGVIRTRFGSTPGGKMSADQLVFEVTGSLLTTADGALSPGLRSALFRALAAIPGVRVGTGTTSVAGRSGVAVSRTESGIRREIVVDPATARALGTREVAVDASSGPPAGTVLMTITAVQRTVGSIGTTA